MRLLLDRTIGVHSYIGSDRKDELFQSRGHAVLLHIVSKELDVPVEISGEDCDELDKNQDSTKTQTCHPQGVR